jgi:hypothetical protein
MQQILLLHYVDNWTAKANSTITFQKGINAIATTVRGTIANSFGTKLTALIKMH